MNARGCQSARPVWGLTPAAFLRPALAAFRVPATFDGQRARLVCGVEVVLTLAAWLTFALLLVVPSTVVAADAPAPQTLEDAIAALELADPGSPEALNDRLEYAQLIIDAVDVDCHQRLDAAQSQLDTVSHNPETDVVLPNGRARVTDNQYRLKLARASCGAAPVERESDLREALAAAQQAVGLYRDALDYKSMAIMQFNVGVAQRMLGDNDAAVASLESTVSMDREFGFRQEVEDNSKLLALWKRPENAGAGKVIDNTTGDAGQVVKAAAEPADAPTAAPAASPPDAPSRSVALKFAWSANDATLGVSMDHAGVVDDTIIHGRAYHLFKQHVHANYDGWVVSYEPRTLVYDVATWPSEIRAVHELAYTFGRALPLPGFEVSTKGDFEHVTHLGSVATDQTAAVRAMILGHMPAAGGKTPLPAWVVRATKTLFAPAAVEQAVAEDYDFETGVWIGARLEQGVWYNMSVPLTMPGARQLLIPHDVEFAYTRDVPCAATASSLSSVATHSCVEIVVHATPETESLAALIQYVDRSLRGDRKVRFHYWSSTYMRIVADPNTLTTYVYEARRYWHASGDTLDHEPPDNDSETLVSTFTYP